MKYIFVYNADSGKLNAYKDMLHKIISPSTYQCSLCDITYGVFKEKEIWKNFRQSSAIDFEFLHKNEFYTKYKSKFLLKYDLPIILAENHGELEIAVSKKELDNLKNAEELITLVIERSTVH
ncbi:GTPase [Aequorivita lipolytica]|uniref:GTPase n=1 Tax=Aequorivita lipolytica TaxID=153267 RepID=A0A5C6YTQ8_9FLAO|nr:GTPase [Aequorivita lipolytica]TXD70872.1 GTPase [Aequorivita lipolytica]SRX49925.1 hypothetical protein AEQU2_00390 [Aequorivita lipolytica]